MCHLTLSCPEIDLASVVWTCHTFENNFGTKHKFSKYLTCRKGSDEHFTVKYFLNIAFVRQITPKLSEGFGCYGHEWLNVA